MTCYTQTWQEHVQHLRKTFDKLGRHGLILQRKKCCFAQEQVTYLGFVVGACGIRPRPEKTKTILKWREVSENRQQIRAFLGMVAYYRRLIPGFNKSAYALHQLLRDDAPHTWMPQHTKAVRELKEKLAAAVQVKSFNPALPVVIKTDANKYATGAVLEQQGHPVAFESRKTRDAEQKPPDYEAELKAIVYALAKWRPLLLGRKVKVQTDHATLARIFKQRQVSPRLGYWLDKLAEYELRIEHVPGKENQVADAISRRPDFASPVTQ